VIIQVNLNKFYLIYMQIFVALIGLFISFIVLINIKTTNKANYFLVLYLIIINLFNVMNYSTLLSNNPYLVAIFKLHFMPVVVLSGPSLYLYIRSLIKDDASLQKNDIIHIIPAIVLFINNFKYNFLVSFDQKLKVAQEIILHDRSLLTQIDPVFFSTEIVYFLRSGLAITYMLLSTFLVIKNYKFNSIKKSQNILVFRWLVLLLLFSYIYNFAIFFYVIKLLKDWGNGFKLSFVSVGWYIYGVGSLMVINLILFFFPSILYGIPRLDYYILKPKEKRINEGIVEIKEGVDTKPIKEFEISEEKLTLIGEKIDNYCIERPYLRLEFSLSLMSKEIGIPTHHLSYFFNEFLEIDFAKWKNNKRIDYVLELMHAGNNEYLTLDALSKQAGFGSRSTFVNAFKQKMGMTPSDYINSL